MDLTFTRWRRRALLRILGRATPDGLLRRAWKTLPSVVAHAQRRSQAYAVLYREAGLASAAPRDAAGLSSLPILEKKDLFERFTLEELLADDAQPADLAGVLTSSGYGGANFAFGVSTWRNKHRTPMDIDLGLEYVFRMDLRRTLLVNCLPMGVVLDSHAVCVANVSVREDMACAILSQAGPRFDKCVLVIDPLFAKRLLDYAAQQNVNWAALKLRVVIGEETFSEEFRTYLASALSIPMEIDDAVGIAGGEDSGMSGSSSPPGASSMRISSSMGVGELGLNLFFETAETLALRRALHKSDPDALLPNFFCYNPLRSLIEIVDTDEDGIGDLVITMLDPRAPIPMIRYRTGDRARHLNAEDLAALSPAWRAAFESQSLPVIAHLGREPVPGEGDWPADRCKALLYRDPVLARHLSGAFVLRRERGVLHWHVQRAPGAIEPIEVLTTGLAGLVDAVVAGRELSETPQLAVWPYEDFPWGMGLDHERKFRYRASDV